MNATSWSTAHSPSAVLPPHTTKVSSPKAPWLNALHLTLQQGQHWCQNALSQQLAASQGTTLMCGVPYQQMPPTQCPFEAYRQFQLKNGINPL
jgi:hypothetical protein